jgi:hypothetical protein
VNSFIEYIPESLNDHKAFIDLILSIIDTKLQYVKHRTDLLINAHNIAFSEAGYHTIELQSNSTIDEDSILANREQVFSLIEQYSKSTNLLLTMRTEISESNVSRIYDLLSNDQYLHFETEELISMLKPNKK